jgi:predicted DNA-binding transcriptional regulator YafY
MDRTERLQKILRLIRHKGHTSTQTMLRELEVSPATLKRDLEFLRSRVQCPLIWDSNKRGYVIKEDEGSNGRPFELPGLWFSASEIYALLTMQHLLKDMEPGLLEAHIQPLQTRLRQLMEKGDHTAEEIQRRVRLIHFGTRRVESKHFEHVARALLDRKRLTINYLNRDREETTEREVSPLQLVHYRENWLLDAWCHMRQALRSFSLDAIQNVSTLDTTAIEVKPEVLAEHFQSGYGIFAGQARYRAKLKFTPARAQWVALETWHSDQTSEILGDGSYILEVPYSNDQELVMDLLRHGTEVEVLAPPELRRKVAATLMEAARKYLKTADK